MLCETDFILLIMFHHLNIVTFAMYYIATYCCELKEWFKKTHTNKQLKSSINLQLTQSIYLSIHESEDISSPIENKLDTYLKIIVESRITSLQFNVASSTTAMVSNKIRHQISVNFVNVKTSNRAKE